METNVHSVIQTAPYVTVGLIQTVKNAMNLITLILIMLLAHVYRIVRIINGKMERQERIQSAVYVIEGVPDALVLIQLTVPNVLQAIS
jgi:hypothetical protein